MARRQALAGAAILALAAGLAVGAHEHGSSAQSGRSGNLAAKRARARDGRPDARRDGRAPQRPAPDRRPGRDVRPQLRLFSLCCPSRATFLTGQYSHNNGVRGNTPPNGGYQELDKSNTLSVWLQRSGYYTVHLGKFLNGYGRQNPTEIPPGWSEWHGSVDPTTYRYYNYTLNENGTLHTYCATPDPSCYQTDVYREKANEIIKRRAGQGPSSCGSRSSATTRGTPREPDDPPKLGDTGSRATPPRCARGHRHASEAELQRGRRLRQASRDQEAPLLTAARIAAIQENWQQRRETLMSVDEAIASIVETLRQSGQLDNTLILFTSDNGFFHGEHRVANGKVLWYEPSIHLPLLMRWTGNKSLPKGVHRSQLAMNVDDAETILDATGANPGRTEDGVSLLPFWRDAGKEIGRDLLLDNSPGAAPLRRHSHAALQVRGVRNGDRELYDLRKDPYELQSQHANPAYDALKASLATRLHNLVTCKGAACRARPAVAFTASRQGRCGAIHATVTGAERRASRSTQAGGASRPTAAHRSARPCTSRRGRSCAPG